MMPSVSSSLPRGSHRASPVFCVDGAVRRLEYAYCTAGLPETFTTYSAATGGSVVNQVLRQYNGLAQVTAEFQNHGGAVVTSGGGASPKVEYTYSEMSGGANHSRLTKVTYPNGRVLRYEYGSGLDASISRVSFLADDSSGSVGTHLEEYSYLGLSAIVQRTRPEPGVGLTFDSGNDTITGDAGDRYVGLDRFGQVIDQRWATSGGTDKDRFGYGYDRNGNRTSRDVLGAGNPGTLDEAYFYDGLDRLTKVNRGTLASGTITDANATFSQTWDLDGVGNWDSFTTDDDGGTPDGDIETRDHNAGNQITGGVGSNAPEYDANGNMTEDQDGFDYTFDAWNHLASFNNGTVSQTYAYDALRRRIVEDPSDGDATDLYYNLGGQVLEERVGGTTELQNVWGLGYVNQLVLRDRETPAAGTLDERLYVQQDANYNVTSVMDYDSVTTTWFLAERYTYLPYGGQTVRNGAGDSLGGADWSDDTVCGGDGKSDYLVTVGSQGGRRDTLTGDVHFGERDYDVELGRMKTPDPTGYSDGMNSYEFVMSSPAGNMDAHGLATTTPSVVQPPFKLTLEGSSDLRTGTDLLKGTLTFAKLVGGLLYSLSASETMKWTRTAAEESAEGTVTVQKQNQWSIGATAKEAENSSTGYSDQAGVLGSIGSANAKLSGSLMARSDGLAGGAQAEFGFKFGDREEFSASLRAGEEFDPSKNSTYLEGELAYKLPLGRGAELELKAKGREALVDPRGGSLDDQTSYDLRGTLKLKLGNSVELGFFGGFSGHSDPAAGHDREGSQFRFGFTFKQ